MCCGVVCVVCDNSLSVFKNNYVTKAVKHANWSKSCSYSNTKTKDQAYSSEEFSRDGGTESLRIIERESDCGNSNNGAASACCNEQYGTGTKPYMALKWNMTITSTMICNMSTSSSSTRLEALLQRTSIKHQHPTAWMQ